MISDLFMALNFKLPGTCKASCRWSCHQYLIIFIPFHQNNATRKFNLGVPIGIAPTAGRYKCGASTSSTCLRYANTPFPDPNF
jgi:hypothetical protein